MDISLKRIIAFVIDIIIVSLLFKVIYLLPIDPYKDKYNETYIKYTDVIENDTNSKEEIISLNYDIYKYRVFSSITSITIFILYFGVLQYLLKGQTLGKKIMKLKVICINDKNVTISKYILRIIVLNNIWVTLLNMGSVYIFEGINFYYITYIISMLSSLIYMMNLIMIMFRKDNRGLHDFISSTKVIDLKNEVKLIN